MKKHEHAWNGRETQDAYYCVQCGYLPQKGWRSYWIPGADTPVDAILPVLILGGSALVIAGLVVALTRFA